MIFWENFRIAFKAIYANKMRSVLTTLGIIIGVAAVVAMLAVGEGSRQKVLDPLGDQCAERDHHQDQEGLDREGGPPADFEREGRHQRSMSPRICWRCAFGRLARACCNMGWLYCMRMAISYSRMASWISGAS